MTLDGSGDRVRSKLEAFEAPDPLARDPDPWAAFRSIEVVDVAWSHRYRHSLGKYSRFFLALEEGRLLATRCPQSGKVWMPPRPVCPEELAVTDWVELPGTGNVAGFTVVHRQPLAVPGLATPHVLGYVALDGADTLFLHVLDVRIEDARQGMRVRAFFRDGPVDHPIWLLGFEPAEDEGVAGDAAMFPDPGEEPT